MRHDGETAPLTKILPARQSMNMILKIAMRRPVIAVTRPESLRCPWGRERATSLLTNLCKVVRMTGTAAS